MDKAARAVRRSSAKLLGGGHADLHLLLSQVKEMRNSAKNFMTAQNAVAQDLLKWAVHEENRAVQDVANQLAELNLLWTEVQREFGEHIKDYRYMYEMVLEGEKHVSNSKNNLASCEQREIKVRKELKKAFKKASNVEIQNLEGRLSQAERAKDLAQMEVTDRLRENESVKLIRLKEGLMKLSQAYSDFGRKCVVIFDAQQDIVQQLPDVLDQDLEDIKYTGSGVTRYKVQQAKEKVRNYRRASCPVNTKFSEPPPPYTIQNDESEANAGCEDNFGSHRSIYPELVMRSPRRRVNSTLEYTYQAPSIQQPPQQPQTAQETSPQVASTPVTTRLKEPPKEATVSPPSNLPSQPPATISRGLSSSSKLSEASALSAPAQLPSPTSSISTPPPRPSYSPGQGTAAAARATSSLSPLSPPTPVSSSPTSHQLFKSDNTERHGCRLYPNPHILATSTPATLPRTIFPETPPSPDLPTHKHHHSDVTESEFSPTTPTDTADKNLAMKHSLGMSKESCQYSSLDIVDLNPDWDNSYEEDLTGAMGGAKI